MTVALNQVRRDDVRTGHFEWKKKKSNRTHLVYRTEREKGTEVDESGSSGDRS